MPFDPQAILANLIEQERIKGHHSAEGRAIRTLGRALSGWTAGNLSPRDVLVLCDQAIQDWLKARLKRSPWSVESMPKLLHAAIGENLITAGEMTSLQELHNQREHQGRASTSADRVDSALEFCIRLLEKHW